MLNNFDDLLRRLEENEEIARRFFAVETKILSILNFRDLVEVLLSEIRNTFGIPFAWLSLIETSEVLELIRSLEAAADLEGQINLIDRPSFTSLVGTSMTPVLINRDLKPYFKLFPTRGNYLIKSLAIAPVSLDGEIIGSLNQADISPRRFEPGMDTTLLKQLGVKLSLCLSNVTAHEKLGFLAYHDSLTGLLNRRVMSHILGREWSRAARYRNPLSVVFIDLDDFKGVNDTYGHDRGDLLLTHLADILKAMCRESDTVARYAGDEFVVILPETREKNAARLMERIRAHADAHPADAGGMAIPVSISYGVASTEADGVDGPERLLKLADERLYNAKKEAKKEKTGAGSRSSGERKDIRPPSSEK
jgi:diguanylate cyclase (GGDEF)-like protein